jgi:hypothetical protein
MYCIAAEVSEFSALDLVLEVPYWAQEEGRRNKKRPHPSGDPHGLGPHSAFNTAFCENLKVLAYDPLFNLNFHVSKSALRYTNQVNRGSP